MESVSAHLKEHGVRRESYLFFVAGCVLLVIASVIGITDNPPGVGSMLLGLFALALGVVYFFAKSSGRKPAYQLLYWAPRVLCIVFTLFISMFALDVFGEGRGFWQTLVALTMHLIPTFLLLAILWASWRREWIAGVLFPSLGVFYIVSVWNRPFATWATLLLMAGPLVFTGALFLLNWYYRSELRGKA
ncbi:MAG TPA: hypothetical protein VMT32_07645 [Bryobacteraceae bacterium]|nr:hypothetical protein [Bryobacteraceae bacterium]